MIGKVLPVACAALAVIVLSVSPGWAQGTGTVPLPGGPAGGGAPVFVQPPSAHPVAAPEVSAPTPPSGTPPAGSTSTAPATAPKGEAPATPSIPQLTSFPELTRGVGTSEALLKD